MNKRDRDGEPVAISDGSDDDDIPLADLVSAAAPQEGEDKENWFEHNIDGVAYIVCKLCYPKFGGTKDQHWKRHSKSIRGVIRVENFSAKQRHSLKHAVAKAKPRQNSTQMKITSFSKLKAEDVAAWICCVGLSYNAIQNQLSQRILSHSFQLAGVAANAKGAKCAVTQTASKLRAELLGLMRHSAVLIAIDGGTVLSKTFLNVTLCWNKQSFFWKSIGATQLTADFISRAVGTVVDELVAAKVFPIGCVSDNATAMIAAIRMRGEEESSSEDSGGEPDADPEDVLGIHVPEGVGGGRFFRHVRCWAHGYQLYLGDLGKSVPLIQTAFEAVQRICKVIRKRAMRAKLSAAAEGLGIRIRRIRLPCVTRWNSVVKALVDVSALAPAINAVVEDCNKVTEAEAYAITVAVLVCVPVAWCTDAVQGDSITAESAAAIMTKLLLNFESLTSARYATIQMREDVGRAVRKARELLTNRALNFSNDFVQLLDFFDPMTPDDSLDVDKVCEFIRAYWSDRGNPPPINSVEEALATYLARTPDEKPDFWKTRHMKYPLITKFIEVVSNAAITEASVERSFLLQTRRFRFDRNRLSLSTLNDEMFVANVYPKLRGTSVHKPVTTANIMKEDEWKSAMDNLSRPIAQQAQTQMVTRHAAALSLQRGFTVTVNERSALILGPHADCEKGTYNAVFDGETNAFKFSPLGEHRGKWEKVD